MSLVKVAVLLRSDPAGSGRAAEGLRVAVGLAVGPLDVEVLLLGPGVRILSAGSGALEDGEEILAHLRRLDEAGVPLRAVAEGLGALPAGPGSGHEVLDRAAIAAALARADRVLPF